MSETLERWSQTRTQDALATAIGTDKHRARGGVHRKSEIGEHPRGGRLGHRNPGLERVFEGHVLEIDVGLVVGHLWVVHVPTVCAGNMAEWSVRGLGPP